MRDRDKMKDDAIAHLSDQLMAFSALKHAEDLLKNAAKWLDKHTTSTRRIRGQI
jgi:hypothetical protein